MSLNPTRLAIGRIGWAAYTIVEVALFVTANLTAKNSGNPGTVSDVFFGAFIGGLVLALLLGAATLIRHRRITRPRARR